MPSQPGGMKSIGGMVFCTAIIKAPNGQAGERRSQMTNHYFAVLLRSVGGRYVASVIQVSDHIDTSFLLRYGVVRVLFRSTKKEAEALAASYNQECK